MAVVEPTFHVRDSIFQIDDHNWLLGGKALITRSSTVSLGSYLWDDDEGFYYSISDASEEMRSLFEAHPQGTGRADPAIAYWLYPPFKLVHDAGDCHVVWKVGNAYVKVNIIQWPNVTREHVTIAAVKNTMSPSFPIPDVLYHGQWDGRYYLITSALPGKTLNEAWPDMDEVTKSHYVNRIVEICTELAAHQADYMSGVDKGEILDLFLAGDRSEDLSHDGLLKVCKELKMDCSKFCFYHCDLGPTNMIVGLDESLGVIDWEAAGYVPKEWIRTRYRVSGGLDFDNDLISDKDSRQLRMRVQRRMQREGYGDCAVKWLLLRGRDLSYLQ